MLQRMCVLYLRGFEGSTKPGKAGMVREVKQGVGWRRLQHGQSKGKYIETKAGKGTSSYGGVLGQTGGQRRQWGKEN